MNFTTQSRQFKLALLSLTICGFLILLIMASFGVQWGTAYGQTVPGGVEISDPSISKTADPSAAGAGAPVMFTITVRNPGSQTATNLVVKDNVPDQFEVKGVTSTKGQVSISGQLATITIDSMAPGEVITIQVQSVVRPGGPQDAVVANTASLVSQLTGREINRQAVASLVLNPTGKTIAHPAVVPGLPHAGDPGPVANPADDNTNDGRLGWLAGLGLLVLICLGVMANSFRRNLPR